MNTFYQLWNVRTPAEAKAKIQEQCKEYEHITNPQNLEEQALKLCRKRYLPATDKRIYGETMGTFCNRASGIYH